MAVQVFRASVDAGSEAVCVFEDLDERYHVSISKSGDKKLIWIQTGASMQNELLYVSTATPEDPFEVLYRETLVAFLRNRANTWLCTSDSSDSPAAWVLCCILKCC